MIAHPVQVPDLLNSPDYPAVRFVAKAGYRALLAMPLLREDAGHRRARDAPAQTAGEFRRDGGRAAADLRRAVGARASQNARLFQEIREKSQQLEVASQLKSQFLANMSHELRTPLNAIIGVTEMLHEDAVDLKREDELEPLERVLRAAKHLLALINDILDLSKIEAGKMDIHLESFAIAPLIEDVVQTIGTMAAKNGNTVVVDCAAGPRHDARRPDADPAGAAQSREQRQQVHRARHRHHRREARHRGGPRVGDAGGDRHRHRPDARADGQALPGLRRRPTPRPRASTAAPGSGSRSAGASAR